MRGTRFVRAVAATLAFIAFYSGLLNLARPLQVTDLEGETITRLQEHPELDYPFLSFMVTSTSLNPAERRLQASLMSVPRPGATFPDIITDGDEPVFTDGVLRPAFADEKLEITLGNSSLGTSIVSYPLANLNRTASFTDARRVSVSIPVQANPAQFPNDSYSLDLTFAVYLPRGMRVRWLDEASNTVVVSQSIGTVYRMAIDSRLGQWTFDLTEGVSVQKPFDAAGERMSSLHASFSRHWTYWAFVYAVSLMPAVIGLSFYVRTRRQRGASDNAAAMELAAALLALIALRQVFVPTDITGLTRLDFVLGAQLLAVCWLMAVTYVADPSPSRPAKQPPRKRRRLTPRVPDGAVRRIS